MGKPQEVELLFITLLKVVGKPNVVAVGRSKIN